MMMFFILGYSRVFDWEKEKKILIFEVNVERPTHC